MAVVEGKINQIKPLVILTDNDYDDIVYDIMNEIKLKKLLGEVARMKTQVGSLKTKRLISLAKKCGWELFPRGNHPIYENTLWPDCPFLTIPNHSEHFRKHTAKSTLQQIEGVLITQLEIIMDNIRPTNEEGED